MLLTKPQATAVAECLAALSRTAGIVTIEFAKPWRVKIVQMFDGSLVVASTTAHDGIRSVEPHASVGAFHRAYGVA